MPKCHTCSFFCAMARKKKWERNGKSDGKCRVIFTPFLCQWFVRSLWRQKSKTDAAEISAPFEKDICATNATWPLNVSKPSLSAALLLPSFLHVNWRNSTLHSRIFFIDPYIVRCALIFFTYPAPLCNAWTALRENKWNETIELLTHRISASWLKIDVSDQVNAKDPPSSPVI